MWHRSIKACNVSFDTWSKNTLEAWACNGEAKSNVISKSTQQAEWSAAVLFVNWSRGILGVNFQIVVISRNNVPSAASACSMIRQFFSNNLYCYFITLTNSGFRQVTLDMYFSRNNLKPTPSSAVITLVPLTAGVLVYTFECVQNGIKW